MKSNSEVCVTGATAECLESKHSSILSRWIVLATCYIFCLQAKEVSWREMQNLFSVIENSPGWRLVCSSYGTFWLSELLIQKKLFITKNFVSDCLQKASSRVQSKSSFKEEIRMKTIRYTRPVRCLQSTANRWRRLPDRRPQTVIAIQ